MSSLFFILLLKPVFKSLGSGCCEGGGNSDFPFTPHNGGDSKFLPLLRSLSPSLPASGWQGLGAPSGTSPSPTSPVPAPPPPRAAGSAVPLQHPLGHTDEPDRNIHFLKYIAAMGILHHEHHLGSSCVGFCFIWGHSARIKMLSNTSPLPWAARSTSQRDHRRPSQPGSSRSGPAPPVSEQNLVFTAC